MTFTRRFREAICEIEINNPDGIEKGIREVKLNGKPIEFPIKPQAKDSINRVAIVMGKK